MRKCSITRFLVTIAVFAGQVPLLQAAANNSVAYFNGMSWISYDTSAYEDYMATTVDTLKFRLKTSSSEGLIFYAGGSQGDFICLQLYEGKLNIAYNLGRIAWFETAGKIVVTSWLDDNRWHDVLLTRSSKHVNVNVDSKQFSLGLKGPSTHLNLDLRLYLGGVSTFYQPGITVRKNFVGCIENFVWNDINMTRDMDLEPRLATYGAVATQCPVKRFPTSMTFFNESSRMLIVDRNLEANYLFVKLEFRTFDKDCLIIWKPLNDYGHFFLRVGPSGNIEYYLKASPDSFEISQEANSNDGDGSYTDGRWHALQLQAIQNKVTLVIDGKRFEATGNFGFTMDKYMYVGGGFYEEQKGFRGCIRGLKVQYEDPGGNNDILCGMNVSTQCTGVNMGACNITDRCFDRPCDHDSICVPTYDSFICDCSGTGYTGATCHEPLYPNSCQQMYEEGALVDGRQISAMIDIDGAGPLKPFAVQCLDNFATGKVETELSHDTMFEKVVDGYQAPGSYSRVINYDANVTQIDQLVHRATSCKQQIRYRCKHSRLLQTPAMNFLGDGTGMLFAQVYEAYGWWIGRNNLNNYYWGGATPGTHKCACGIQGTCEEGEPRCNCDAGLPDSGIYDSGYLTYKEHLPVMELRFGDTGALYDAKMGWYSLGPLICAGDTYYDHPITFRKEDSIIFFHPWDLQSEVWDVSFRFKTTAENGVMVHRSGEEDFVEIQLINATQLSLKFSAGYGHQSVTVDTSPTKLNHNQWHTVYAERNKKETVLSVENRLPVKLEHPVGVVYSPFKFNRPLVVGARTNFTGGYVGCMSSLQVGGETLDLYDKVKNDANFSYGVELGCVGKCDTKPCLHGGVCSELYSDFTCDCRGTPFDGRICGKEVGIPLYEEQMLVYQPITNGFAMPENITIGFKTRRRGGIILQLTDDRLYPTEYMIIELTSSGDLRIRLRYSNNKMEFSLHIGNGIQFGDGQVHILKFWITGRFVANIQVDDYEPTLTGDLQSLFAAGMPEIPFNFNYLLLGRNASSADSVKFSGCLFRAWLDTYLPIKMLYTKFNVSFVVPNSDHTAEVDCGIDEILPPAEPIEHRPDYEVSPPATPPTPTTQPSTQTSTTPSNAQYVTINAATPLVFSRLVGFIPLLLFYFVS